MVFLNFIWYLKVDRSFDDNVAKIFGWRDFFIIHSNIRYWGSSLVAQLAVISLCVHIFSLKSWTFLTIQNKWYFASSVASIFSTYVVCCVDVVPSHSSCGRQWCLHRPCPLLSVWTNLHVRGNVATCLHQEGEKTYQGGVYWRR